MKEENKTRAEEIIKEIEELSSSLWYASEYEDDDCDTWRNYQKIEELTNELRTLLQIPLRVDEPKWKEVT